MAKGNVEQAEIEAPYELPEGWKWCRLGEICEKIKRGKSPKYADKSGTLVFAQKCNQPDGTMSLEKALFLNEELLSKYKDDDFVKDGDILINSTGTGTIGRVGYFDKSFLTEGMKLVPDTHVTTVRARIGNAPQFFYYFLKQKESYLELKGVGTTNMKELHADVLENLLFPLPPTLTEQKRIVSRIETLFAKLDEAEEKTRTVLDGFETRKAAILHKAFTGQLRIDNEELTMEDWEEKKLGEVCDSIFDGDHMPPPKAESGIPFLVISNVNTGYLSFDNTRYVPSGYYDSLSETRKPKKGDVLYTIVGSYGIPVLVDSDRVFCFQRHMALLKPSKLISSKYLWYVLQSNEMYQKVTSIATGTAQLTVPIKGLRELTIPVPPLNYQLSIVNFLSTVLEKESRAKEAAQTVLDQIALLKKSILARAFRGEL